MAKMTFETALKQLEEIVAQLESGNLPLEEALKKFEEGTKLSKFCSQKLEETEKRIMMLTRQADGEVTETPFEA
uniref:Exodeoxyribonuclease 7 small subunit n=1 Tax=Desulfatirhabdium butyrativorans TaxID=340467 RepID=A0A7C4RTV3_9BACT